MASLLGSVIARLTASRGRGAQADVHVLPRGWTRTLAGFTAMHAQLIAAAIAAASNMQQLLADLCSMLCTAGAVQRPVAPASNTDSSGTCKEQPNNRVRRPHQRVCTGQHT